MRKLLSASTALAAVLAFAPVHIDFAEAKEKGEKASKSENSRSDRANKDSGGDDGDRGHGNNEGDDPENRKDSDPDDGNSGIGNDDRDGDGDGDEEAGDEPRRVNPISTLNSPKKLNEALEQLGDVELDDIALEVERLDSQELDVLLRGGSTRAIQNALDRLDADLREQIEALLDTQNAELGDIVGLDIERDGDGNVTKIIIFVS